MCGVATPSTVIVGIGECSTGCVGNAAESCGAFRYAIIYSSSSTPAGSTSEVVLTTTNSQGSTIITTSTSVAPVTVPSYSSSTTVLTTTDSKGSTIITTMTSLIPVTTPNYSSSVSVYTTTDSHGSTVTTSSTIVVTISQPTSSGKVTVVTTTNPQGSVITTSTTFGPTSTPTLCPGGTGTQYSDADGNVYEISCGLSYPGSDLPAIHKDTLIDCILACSEYIPQPNVAKGAKCIAASWGEGNPGGNCYLKYAITEVNPTNGGFDSCRLITYTPPGPLSTINHDQNSGTTSTSPATGTSGNTPTTSTTSTSPIDSDAAASPCPAGDGITYGTSSGNAYEIDCSTSFPGNDLPTIHEDTFTACLAACDNYVPSSSAGHGLPCVAVSWGAGNPGGNCYLKYAITQERDNNNGFCSGRLSTYTPPSVSTSTRSGSNSATSGGGSPATSGGGNPATSGGGNPATSGGSNPATSGGGNPATSGGGNPATSTIPRGGTSTTSTSSSSSTTTTSASSSSSLTTSRSTTTSATGTAVSTAASPTNFGYQPTYTPACPANNNTQYIDLAGSLYNIKCGLQVTGRNLKPVHASTFPACIEYCDITTGCAGVTYSITTRTTNNNCYPYSQVSGYGSTSPSGTYSAVLANGGTTNETIDDQVLCPGFSGGQFTDPGGYTYLVGCDEAVAGDDLAPAVTPDLSGCLQYCDTYFNCTAVNWGPVSSTGYNCYPKLTNTGTSNVSGTQFAQLISAP